MTRKNKQSPNKKEDEDPSNKEIYDKLQEIEYAMKFMNEAFEQLKKENKELKEIIKEKNKKNEILEQRINFIENAFEKDEKEKIKNNLIIMGIKTEKNENVEHISESVIKNLYTKINKNQIKTAYRKDSKNENSPIIVELTSAEIKENIIQARKTIGSLTTTECGIKGKTSEIFVNEQLTTLTNILFFKCREIKKANNYKYIWTRDGNIYIRKTDTSKKIKIKNHNDLENLIN